MKKASLFGIVVMIAALLAVAGSAGAGPDAAVPDSTFDIFFVGFCDGLHVNLDPATGIAYGDFMSSCAPCPYPDRWRGNVVFNLHPNTYGWGWTVSWETAYGGAPPHIYSSFSADPKQGTHYWFDGTVFGVFEWKYCYEGAEAEQGSTPTFAR